MDSLSLTGQISIVVILFVFVLLSAIFSALETAFTAIDKVKLELEVSKGSKIARLIKKQYNKYTWTISTILIVNNLVNIAASTLFGFLLSKYFLGPLSPIIATIIITPIIVILGEIIPKIFAKKHAYQYLRKTSNLLQVAIWLFTPFTFFLGKIVLKSTVTTTEEELKNIIFLARKEGVLHHSEATLATNALDLDKKKVIEAMIPFGLVKTHNYEWNLKQVKKQIVKTGLTRIPVMKDQKLIGVFNSKTVIKLESDNWQNFISPSLYISPDSSLSTAMSKMQGAKSHILFVAFNSNHRKILGILTLEDIIEELVGEIYDESDVTGLIRENGLNKYIVDGRCLAYDLFHNFLNFDIKVGYDTTLDSWIKQNIKLKLTNGTTFFYQNKFFFKVIKSYKGKQPYNVFEIIYLHN